MTIIQSPVGADVPIGAIPIQTIRRVIPTGAIWSTLNLSNLGSGEKWNEQTSHADPFNRGGLNLLRVGYARHPEVSFVGQPRYGLDVRHME